MLARSFVGSTIQPLFSEADVLQSGFGQILSGVFSGGVFGSSKPVSIGSGVAAAASATFDAVRANKVVDHPKTALQGQRTF